MTLREMIYNDIKGHKSTIVAKKKKIKKTVLGNTGVDYDQLKAPNFAARDRQEDNSTE